MPDGQNTTRVAWSQAWVLSLTETVSWGILYYAFVPLLVPMQRDLGWSEATLTLGYSIGVLVSALCAPLVGIWLDHHSSRTAMTAGAFLAAGATWLWAQSHEPWMYLLTWVLLGFAMSLTLYEPAFVTLTRWFRQDRANPILLVTICAGFASTIFLPVITWLEGKYGWRDTIEISALLLLVLCAVPHLLVLKHPPPAVSTDASESGDGISLRDAARSSLFWRLTVGFGLQSFASTAVFAFMIAYLIERGDSATFAAAATGSIGGAQVAARIVTTFFGRRFSQIALAAIMLSAQAVAVLTLLTWQSTIGVGVAVVLLGAGRGALTLIRPVLLADAFGTRFFGSISGTQAAIVSACGAIAPVCVGIAFGFLDSYEPIMWMMGGLAIASALVVLSANRSPQIISP